MPTPRPNNPGIINFSLAIGVSIGLIAASAIGHALRQSKQGKDFIGSPIFFFLLTLGFLAPMAFLNGLIKAKEPFSEKSFLQGMIVGIIIATPEFNSLNPELKNQIWHGILQMLRLEDPLPALGSSATTQTLSPPRPAI